MMKPYFFCEYCKGKHELNNNVNCTYSKNQVDWVNYMSFEKCPA